MPTINRVFNNLRNLTTRCFSRLHGKFSLVSAMSALPDSSYTLPKAGDRADSQRLQCGLTSCAAFSPLRHSSIAASETRGVAGCETSPNLALGARGRLR